MRIAFLGTPEFAAPALRALVDDPGITVPLVITQPDRPAGRGRQLQAPAVKSVALELDLTVIQPASMREPTALLALFDANPDLLVVVAYGELLKRAVLDAAPHGAINVHPSLLPRYRGAAPIPAAILNGDAHTGVSIIQLTRRMDAGPLIAQQQLDITPTDTTASLSERLAQEAARMLPDLCKAWSAGVLAAHEQDEAAATYTREWTKDDARIDWHTSADAIERLIRAAQPWPVAWTVCDCERLQVLRATPVFQPATADVAPGAIYLHDGHALARTGAGLLELHAVQPAGKRQMAAADWLRGRRSSSARLA